MIDLSIIIAHYNARSDLVNCIKSIEAARMNMNFEIIVVDNNSENKGELKFLMNTEFPNLRLILNKKNLGFAAANNIGMRLARGKVLLILNPDTIVDSNALIRLYRFLQANDGVGMVGPLIFDEYGNTQYYCGRHFPDLLTEILHQSGLEKLFPTSKLFGRYLMTYWDHRTTREVDLIQGSCMMIKRSALEIVGLMDERFFLFADDVEWCYRFKRKGLKIYFIPKAKIIHKGGTSARDRKSLTFVIGLDSLFKFFSIHYSIGAGMLYRISIFCIYIGKILLCWTHSLHNIHLYLKVLLWSIGLLKFERTDSGNPYLRIA